MDRKAFWKMIDDARPKRGGDREHAQRLEKNLASLDVAEIVSFERNLVELMHESRSADLWNVVRIIQGGCGDDGFDYFRGWLILKGEKAFYDVLENPRRLPGHLKKKEFGCCQEMGGVARQAFVRKTGRWDMPYDGPKGPGALKGRLIADEEELKNAYPDLWKKYVEE